MSDRYPWRNTSEDIAGSSPPQYETPAGAQEKADAVLAAAKQYTDEQNVEFNDHIANADIHVTPADKTNWNSKAAGDHTHPVATPSSAGFESAADKTKLDGIAAGAGTADSATDTVIGNRTATDSVTPGLTGTLTALLSGLFTLIKGITGKSSALTAPATTLEAAKAHMDNTDVHTSASEHAKLAGIEAGAQVNQPAFATVNDVVAAVPEDAMTIEGGTGITVTSNPAIKKLIVTATGTATPGAHASSHITGGSDVIPDAVAGGASGLMSGADKTKVDGAIQFIEKGAANGVAALDASTKLPAGQLPVSAVQATTADITYYVRTDGNDSNNGLSNTAGGAFKTIQKAVKSVPKHADHAVVINVAAGTYAEDVLIADYNGSTEIYIYGGASLADAANFIVNSFYVYGCVNQIFIRGFTAVTTSRQAFKFTNSNFCQLVFCRSVVTQTPTQTGVEASNGTSVRVAGCEFSNKGAALHATQGSTIISASNSGTGNVYGIFATEGGKVTKEGVQTAGTEMEHAYNRGIITSGVMNPWGDNTASSRPFVSASHTAQQTISSANSWLRVICGAESNDNLGNYDPSTGLFNCPTSGMYLVIAAVEVTNAVAGDELKLAVGSDAAVLLNVDHQRPGSSGYQQLTGSAIIVAAANAKLAMWVTSSRSGTTTNPDGYYTYMQVIKIA
ncbi:complement C1q domain-containing protein [Paenibacillus zanthoxyli]|uniref:pectinesterase family protein n=1 Tax=Paenibacillus zanthoxyli TaxID=369399 RepID=UPI0004720B26|nr:pectinesterase family protein [Paenibacillus zanthoxyli]